jgi:hypothetical protein
MDNEVFALRDAERIVVAEAAPDKGRWIIVQLVPVQMPDGNRTTVRACDGAPVEQCAVIACEWSVTNNGWQWLQLSPPTKEFIGDLLFDNGAERNQWHFIAVEQLEETHGPLSDL